MNVFKHLDQHFPCGSERKFGEVVSIGLLLSAGPGSNAIWISSKRKAWYVNASVNAWNVHRDLCRELKASWYGSSLDDLVPLRKLIRHLVEACYLENAASDGNTQYFHFNFEMENVVVDNRCTTFAKATRIRPFESAHALY